MSHSSLSTHDLGGYSPHLTSTTISGHHVLHDVAHDGPETDPFEVLLDSHHHHHRDSSHTRHNAAADEDQDAVDRDMEMLIEHGSDSDSDEVDPLVRSSRPDASPDPEQETSCLSLCTSALQCETDLLDHDPLGKKRNMRNQKEDGDGDGDDEEEEEEVNRDVLRTADGGEVGLPLVAGARRRSAIYDIMFDAPG